MLVGLAVVALAAAGIVTVVGRGTGVALLITYFGGGALMCVMALGLIRQRYSDAGIAWSMGTILTFNVWNIIVLQLTFWAGWKGGRTVDLRPNRGGFGDSIDRQRVGDGG